MKREGRQPQSPERFTLHLFMTSTAPLHPGAVIPASARGTVRRTGAPAALRRRGEAGRAWVDRHHDGVETMDRMLRAFGRVWQERKGSGLPA